MNTNRNLQLPRPCLQCGHDDVETDSDAEASLCPGGEGRRSPDTAGQPSQSHRIRRPALRFSPTAWAKLLYFRDRRQTEVGGFGITCADDLLHVSDFITVRQAVSEVTVRFDDDAVADFFDAEVDAGRRPEQFARLWLHTHPGSSPQPSSTDEETFHRVFGPCQWAVMCIVARGGQTYARLQYNVGPGGSVTIPVEIDFTRPFAASDQQAWAEEYRTNVRVAQSPLADVLGLWEGDTAAYQQEQLGLDAPSAANRTGPDWLDGLEQMTPAERRLVLDELGC